MTGNLLCDNLQCISNSDCASNTCLSGECVSCSNNYGSYCDGMFCTYSEECKS